MQISHVLIVAIYLFFFMEARGRAKGGVEFPLEIDEMTEQKETGGAEVPAGLFGWSRFVAALTLRWRV